MTAITAGIGGFYLHTIWSLSSAQVVLFQQTNLLLSMVITGLDFIAIIRVYTKWKRDGRRELSAFAYHRSLSNLVTGSQHTQEGSLASRNGSDGQSANRRASEDNRAENVGARIQDVAPVDARATRASDSTTTQSLRQVAEQSLRAHDFQSTFRANHIAKEADDAIEDDTPDEAETLLAQQWSEVTQHETCLRVA